MKQATIKLAKVEAFKDWGLLQIVMNNVREAIFSAEFDHDHNRLCVSYAIQQTKDNPPLWPFTKRVRLHHQLWH